MKKLLITVFMILTILPSYATGFDDSVKILLVLQKCADLKDPNRGPVKKLISINDNLLRRRMPTKAEVESLADLTLDQAYCGLLYDIILERADSFLRKE